MEIQRDPRITEEDARTIRFKVLKLIGHYGYTRSDIDPLTEDLQTQLGEVVHKYRADRGARSTFVNRVVKNDILNLIEERTAKKRNKGRQPYAIEGEAKDALRDDRISQADIDTEIDIKDAIAQLPLPLRAVALDVIEYGEAETIRRLHLKRGVVRQRWAEILRHPAFVKLTKSLKE